MVKPLDYPYQIAISFLCQRLGGVGWGPCYRGCAVVLFNFRFMIKMKRVIERRRGGGDV